MASSLLAPLLPVALFLVGGLAPVPEPVASPEAVETTGPVEATTPVPTPTLEEAVTAHHAGNHAQSVALLRRLQAETLTPQEATAVKHLLGRSLVSLGHFDEAISVLMSALRDARRPGRTRLTDHLRWWLARAYEGRGEHLLAARAYGIISRDRRSSLSMDAMLRRASALSADGKVGSERRVLEGFVETYPDSPWIWDAQARLGEIKALVRHHDEAISLYRRVLRYARRGEAARKARLGLLALADRGVHAAMGDTWEQRLDDLKWLVDERRFEEAIPRLEAFHRGARASRQWARSLRAREFLARALRETGEAESALSAYGELRKQGRSPTTPTRIAHLHASLGNHGKAEEVLLEAHARRKTRAYWRQLGRLRMTFGRYQEAEKALRRAAAGRSRRSTEALWRDIAWCAVRTGPPERAMKLLERIATREPHRRTWATYWQARSLQDGGRLEDATERFRTLAQEDPFSYYGLLSWSRVQDIASMALAAGRAPMGPNGTTRDDEATGQVDDQLPRPGTPRATPTPRGPLPASHVPEVPRTHPPLSPPVALLSSEPPAPYTSGVLLASAGEVVLPSPDSTTLEIGPTLEEAGLEPEVRGTLRWTEEMARFDPRLDFLPKPRPERLLALEALAGPWGKVAPQAQRALELERLGLTGLATDELRVLEADVRTLRRHGWRSLVGRGRSDMLDNRRRKKARGGANIRHLGRRTRSEARAFMKATGGRDFRRTLRDARIALGDPHASRKRALERGRLDGSASNIDLERWRAAYPLAWRTQVSAACGRFDVPPHFVYGIMTVESAFHAHAVSISHAYGALQMIPRTGRRVSSELELPSFTPELLLEPEYGIPMGVQYMGRLLDRFHHQEPLAAAAYNAGPHRVAAWLDANPNRPLDVFVEEIPFTQARNYTKSVLKHTARIRHVYHGEDRMYVSNTLIAAHGEHPNY